MAGRELTWIVPGVRRETEHWRRAAALIPSPALRQSALLTLRRERLDTEGAALFCIVPPEVDAGLLRLLATYQILLDYLDTISELPDAMDPAVAARLQRALVDAVHVDADEEDYMEGHPCGSDGGYLAGLVAACRDGLRQLPGWPAVADRAIGHAERLQVQQLNHGAGAEGRLRRWAAGDTAFDGSVRWFEWTAGCSSSLALFALFALAAGPRPGPRCIERVDAAYSPWINAASTMLDSFVDQIDDARTGNHSYVRYYGDDAAATAGIAALVHESMARAWALPRGERHALIASGMVAMYLSHSDAWRPELRTATRHISRAAGPLQHVQLPIMRIFRAVHGLRSA